MGGGLNTFVYVHEPISAIDPLGLMGGRSGGRPSGNAPANYFGGEGHFFLGAGLTTLTCTDNCGKRQTFRFWKICFGGAIGFSGGGGLVAGVNGKNCSADNYKGWFYEAGASYGYGSAGGDVGYNDDGPLGLPGSTSGVVEGGIGGGLGAKVKSTWCYYFPL